MARTPYYASLVMARKREEEKNRKEPVIEQVPFIQDEIKVSNTEPDGGSEKVEETITKVETPVQQIEEPIEEPIKEPVPVIVEPAKEPVIPEPIVTKPLKKKSIKEGSDEK